MKKAAGITFVMLALASLVLIVPFAYAQPNESVEKIVFIHFVKGAGTSPAATDQSQNFKLMSGAKWQSAVTYYVNPTGSGLGGNAVLLEVQYAFEVWDVVTSKELFNPAILDTSASYSDVRDSKNTVTWGYISNSGIIAQTSIWYSRATKTVLECDIVFSTNPAIPWGIDPDGQGPRAIGAFDVRNIATHESGHWLVLLDLYSIKDSELTMFGYSAIGETKKTTLGRGDTLGCLKLYGT